MSDYQITTANSSLEFDTTNGSYHSCLLIDDNHAVNFWTGAINHGYTQIFTVNTSTWAVTTSNSTLEFDTQAHATNSCYKIDDNHIINFWQTIGDDGNVQVFTVNTSTWAITTASTVLEFDTTRGAGTSCFQIDTNHFINFWSSTSELKVQSFTVNTSTWAVTTSNSYLAFQSWIDGINSCFQIDTNHFINFWKGIDYKGYVEVFTVNTSTFAITTANSSLEFDTTYGLSNSCYQIDGNHFINFWGGTDFDGFVQVFEINTSTWEVSTAGNKLEFDTTNSRNNTCYQIDGNHFVNFWRGADNDGHTQTFTVNTSTWAVTTANTVLEFDTTNGLYNSCYRIDTNHYINFWSGADSDGYVQVFAVDVPITTNIKAINGALYAVIKEVDSLAIASVKDINGLA